MVVPPIENVLIQNHKIRRGLQLRDLNMASNDLGIDEVNIANSPIQIVEGIIDTRPTENVVQG